MTHQKVEGFFNTFRDHIFSSKVTKYAQADIGPVPDPLPAEYVFLALQIPTDRVQALARVPMVEMLNLVARRFAGTGTSVVVKRHPLCRDGRITAALNRLSKRGDVLVRKDNIHDLIAGSQAVITTNSGVGSEALIHLKPVYLFGAADYSAVTHNVTDEADFLQKTSPITIPVSESDIKRFIYYYRRLSLVDITDRARLRAVLRNRVIEKAVERASMMRTRKERAR